MSPTSKVVAYDRRTGERVTFWGRRIARRLGGDVWATDTGYVVVGRDLVVIEYRTRQAAIAAAAERRTAPAGFRYAPVADHH